MSKCCSGCGNYIGKDEGYVAIPLIDPYDPHYDTYEFYHLECLPDNLKALISACWPGRLETKSRARRGKDGCVDG